MCRTSVLLPEPVPPTIRAPRPALRRARRLATPRPGRGCPGRRRGCTSLSSSLIPTSSRSRPGQDGLGQLFWRPQLRRRKAELQREPRHDGQDQPVLPQEVGVGEQVVPGFRRPRALPRSGRGSGQRPVSSSRWWVTCRIGLLGPQGFEVLQNLPASRGVEHRGGLVEDEYLGFDGEEASQGDALLLAAGEGVGLAALVAIEADGPYSPGDALAHLLAGDAEVLEAEGDVVLDERGDEAVLRVLEEDAEMFADLEGFRGRVVAGYQYAARLGPAGGRSGGGPGWTCRRRSGRPRRRTRPGEGRG